MTRRSYPLRAAAFAMLILGTSATAGELVGPAQTVDGGSIVVAGRHLQLDGLDAPALDRLCLRGGKSWRCGEAAAFALAGLIERHWLTCITRDLAGVTAASCRMGGPKGIDIGGAMVRDGWAEARPGSGYEPAEQEARQAGRGLWATR